MGAYLSGYDRSSVGRSPAATKQTPETRPWCFNSNSTEFPHRTGNAARRLLPPPKGYLFALAVETGRTGTTCAPTRSFMDCALQVRPLPWGRTARFRNRPGAGKIRRSGLRGKSVNKTAGRSGAASGRLIPFPKENQSKRWAVSPGNRRGLQGNPPTAFTGCHLGNGITGPQESGHGLAEEPAGAIG